MSGSKEIAEYKEFSDDIKQLAENLCRPIGYGRSDLVAYPLDVLKQSLNLDNHLSLKELALHTSSGVEVDQHILFSSLLKDSTDPDVIIAELNSNDLDSMTSPSNPDSWLSKMTNELNKRDNHVAIRLPTFDLVNSNSLNELIGFNNPSVEVDNSTRIFHRFTTEILGNHQVGWPSQGLPRVTLTNGFKMAGNHLSLTIEVPNVDRKYIKVFQLLVTREREEEQILARKRLSVLQETNVRYVHEPMMDLAAEAAKIALDLGYFPYGAVLHKDDGNIVVARNAANKNGHLSEHAEYLAMSQERDPSHELGTLYTTTEPCHSCCQQIAETDVRLVYFALEQAEEWQGKESLRQLLNSKGRKVFFEQLPEAIYPNLKIMGEGNSRIGKFPGQFDETIRINYELYESWKAKGMPPSWQWKTMRMAEKNFLRNFS